MSLGLCVSTRDFDICQSTGRYLELLAQLKFPSFVQVQWEGARAMQERTYEKTKQVGYK
jgi:hypothetical protein